jgi:hypothetical protein
VLPLEIIVKSLALFTDAAFLGSYGKVCRGRTPAMSGC